MINESLINENNNYDIKVIIKCTCSLLIVMIIFLTWFFHELEINNLINNTKVKI